MAAIPHAGMAQSIQTPASPTVCDSHETMVKINDRIVTDVDIVRSGKCRLIDYNYYVRLVRIEGPYVQIEMDFTKAGSFKNPQTFWSWKSDFIKPE